MCTGCSSTKTQRNVMTLDAAQFGLIQAEEMSVTQLAYIGDPLYQFHGFRKGRLLQQAISQTLASSPCSKLQRQATCGRRVNGASRGAHQSEFDFMHGERRVECKGASLAWVSSQRSWAASWYKIKFDQDLFDDLFLALHSPGRIDVILHDGVTGVTTSGVRTMSHGHDVRVRASHGVEDASQACQEILDKMLQAPGSCQHMGTMRTDGAFMVSALKKEQATESFSLLSRLYGGVPLSNLGPCSRGHRLEEIAFSIDQKLHPDGTFRLAVESSVESSQVVGTLRRQRRGQNRACADWLRDDTRVKFKSSALSWDTKHQSWRVHFGKIKFGPLGAAETRMFDQLWLGLYSPSGLHVLQYSGTVGLSSTGNATDIFGHEIKICGPKHERSPAVALEVILDKLRLSGCELLATADEEARAKMAAGMQMQQDSDLQKMQEQQAQKQEME
ncbi:unnamed protein product, partial [Symbiodinium sp. CCMP2456]